MWRRAGQACRQVAGFGGAGRGTSSSTPAIPCHPRRSAPSGHEDPAEEPVGVSEATGPPRRRAAPPARRSGSRDLPLAVPAAGPLGHRSPCATRVPHVAPVVSSPSAACNNAMRFAWLTSSSSSPMAATNCSVPRLPRGAVNCPHVDPALLDLQGLAVAGLGLLVVPSDLARSAALGELSASGLPPKGGPSTSSRGPGRYRSGKNGRPMTWSQCRWVSRTVPWNGPPPEAPIPPVEPGAQVRGSAVTARAPRGRRTTCCCRSGGSPATTRVSVA